MRCNRPTYIMSAGMGKERKIAAQVLTATETCVTVKTCVEWGGCTHWMDSFFSWPYALDGLHIWAVSGCVTVRVVNSYWPLDYNIPISKLSGVHARMRNNLTPLMCKEYKIVYILTNMHKLSAEDSFCDEHRIAKGYVTVGDYNQNMWCLAE